MEESNNISPKKPLPTWATPVSVIIAGLLIGAGIFFQPETPSPVPKTPTQIEVKQDIAEKAEDAGVTKGSFATCFSAENKALVQADIDSGNRIGVQGTPFLIFEFVEAGKIKTIVVPGAIQKAMIEQIIRDKKLPEGVKETPLGGEYTYANEQDHKTSSLEGKTVRIVEYSDLDCPYCKRIHPELEAVVASNPNVVWIYRHFPLPNLHPNAQMKAEASECVAKLEGDDAFWKFIKDIMAE